MIDVLNMSFYIVDKYWDEVNSLEQHSCMKRPLTLTLSRGERGQEPGFVAQELVD
jgi:hypothetical protein